MSLIFSPSSVILKKWGQVINMPIIESAYNRCSANDSRFSSSKGYQYVSGVGSMIWLSPYPCVAHPSAHPGCLPNNYILPDFMSRMYFQLNLTMWPKGWVCEFIGLFFSLKWLKCSSASYKFQGAIFFVNDVQTNTMLRINGRKHSGKWNLPGGRSRRIKCQTPAHMSVKLIWLNKFNANRVVLFGTYTSLTVWAHLEVIHLEFSWINKYK